MLRFTRKRSLTESVVQLDSILQLPKSQRLRSFSGNPAITELPKFEKDGKKVPKDKRREMVVSFVNKYLEFHHGKFPSISYVKKEIGGSHYVLRDILQELQYESRINLSTEDKDNYTQDQINENPSFVRDNTSFSLEGITSSEKTQIQSEISFLDNVDQVNLIKMVPVVNEERRLDELARATLVEDVMESDCELVVQSKSEVGVKDASGSCNAQLLEEERRSTNAQAQCRVLEYSEDGDISNIAHCPQAVVASRHNKHSNPFSDKVADCRESKADSLPIIEVSGARNVKVTAENNDFGVVGNLTQEVEMQDSSHKSTELEQTQKQGKGPTPLAENDQKDHVGITLEDQKPTFWGSFKSLASSIFTLWKH